MTLFELLNLVKLNIKSEFGGSYWITAEINEMKDDYYNNNCYLTLVEKDEVNGQPKAKASAIIWSNRYAAIKELFVETTGQKLSAGMKVLLAVTPSLSEKYGFSFYVNDIDPTFTLGDIEAKRQETIRRIKEDGVWDFNRELELPPLLQSVAVISSPTAAGYGDFCNHIQKSLSIYNFKLTLFPAIMQGENSPNSIFHALCDIAEREDEFDAVVIIRGGGATSDLLAFDDYELCSACAQFTLPIISGIGHERDNSILDMVANVRCKTPTAVADFIINSFAEQTLLVQSLNDRLKNIVSSTTERECNRLKMMVLRLGQISASQIRTKEQKLSRKEEALHAAIGTRLMKEDLKLKEKFNNLSNALRTRYVAERHKLELLENSIERTSPEYILKKGFTITLKNGKIVRKANEVSADDKIITVFSDGKKTSVIIE